MRRATEPSVHFYTFEQMLAQDGYIVYSCVGKSMLPLLRQRRDIVEIRPLDGRARKYDVALYKRGGQYILHRVLRVLPEGYIIAGDNNPFVETDVTDDMILGVMTRVVRNGKSITVTDWRYRLYVHIWCDCYPVRMFLLKCRGRAGKLLRGLKGNGHAG